MEFVLEKSNSELKTFQSLIRPFHVLRAENKQRISVLLKKLLLTVNLILAILTLKLLIT